MSVLGTGIDIVENYRPSLILLGHNNILNRETINSIRNKYNSKIALWYEDHLVEGGPNFKNNLNLIEKNSDELTKIIVSEHG